MEGTRKQTLFMNATSDENGMIKFTSTNMSTFQEGKNITLKITDVSRVYKNETIEFPIIYDWNNDHTIKLSKYVEPLTMKFQVFDNALGRTHALPMKLEGHGLVLEGTSDANGYITFSSDLFIEGENYTITVYSNIFSDEPRVITAKNGLDAALTLHPYMPIRITLVTQTGVRNIIDTEIDVFCNTTKVAS